MIKRALIVAVSRNGVIGLDNQLPWHLPEDLQYFRTVTMGKPLIMGRKTFASIGRPLAGRTNIVITRDRAWRAQTVEVAHSLQAALLLAEQACWKTASEEIMIIGGEQIYRMALPYADRLYLTFVDAEVEGDAFFPHIDPNLWHQVSEQRAQITDSHPYRFLVLEKAKG